MPILIFGTNINSFLPYGRIGKLSGTSQATAIVAGFASILMQSSLKKLNYIEVKNKIMKSVNKRSNLMMKCKTGGIFSPQKLLKNINTTRNIATK